MYKERSFVGNDEQKDEVIQQEDEVNPPPPYTPAAHVPSYDAPAQTSNSALVIPSLPTKEKDLPQTHAAVNTANSALMVPSPSKVKELPLLQLLATNDNDTASNGTCELDAGNGEGWSEITALLSHMTIQAEEQQQQQQQQKEEKGHQKQHLRCLLVAASIHLTTIIIPLARELRNVRDATVTKISNVVDVSVELVGNVERMGVGNRVRAAVAQAEQIEADIAAELQRLCEVGVDDVTGSDFGMRDVRGVLLGCGWGGSGSSHLEVAFMLPK